MPNGTFNLNASHLLYYGIYIANIVINSNVVTLDLEMEPIVFDGALEGYVYEENTTNPVAYANIEVNGEYWISTMSDDTGFYHVDLPNGNYSAVCWKNGYYEDTLDWFEINNFTIVNNFYLIPIVEAGDILDAEMKLSQNYPNPFNPETTISFSVTQTSSFVILDIYNIKGQKVKVFDVILSGDVGESNSIVWDGTDDSGKPVSSGVYFYQLKIGNKIIDSKRMLLLK